MDPCKRLLKEEFQNIPILYTYTCLCFQYISFVSNKKKDYFVLSFGYKKKTQLHEVYVYKSLKQSFISFRVSLC